ncbi:MAG TPA: GAF domain-containing sensor histidine kinase [Candidatus Limnocylindrales bacterium]|nr:GAF domain-containing sensor histidine kinase [Candidatus Limnocylindrales bacterium]
MEPSRPAPSRSRRLVVPALLDALEAWQAEPGPATAAPLAARVADMAQHLDLTVGEVHAEAPPLPELHLELTPRLGGRRLDLHSVTDNETVGWISVDGDPAEASALVHAFEVALAATRASARANRAEEQLAALDQAVRGISGVLDVERVLQLIADRVRVLVDARYAAIGIVDADGAIERFITSGISDEERARIGPLPRGHGLLGLIIRENRSYRIREIADHPESYGFPPHHPPMHSFLGTPITTQSGTVGRLYLTNKSGAAEFSQEDQALVEMFALHAGIAIENARLHDQVRRLAIVDERDRISRDLHDSVIQSIYAQTLALDDVPDLVDEDPAEARQRVDEAIDALHAVIRDIRNFIFGLRPVLLESGSLVDGLRHLATELHRNGGVRVEVVVDDPTGAVERLPIETVAEVLAITREALSNVARHAGASTTRIALVTDAERVRLEMTDDGRGFAAEHDPDRGHHGLANMRARAEALGGTFALRSTPGRGTRIIIALRSRSDTDGGDR